jgi:hypothetical protein
MCNEHNTAQHFLMLLEQAKAVGTPNGPSAQHRPIHMARLNSVLGTAGILTCATRLRVAAAPGVAPLLLAEMLLRTADICRLDLVLAARPPAALVGSGAAKET